MADHPLHRHHELIRHQKRETLSTLHSLQNGQLWDPLSPEEYQGMLLDSLCEHEIELRELEDETWPEA